MSNGSGFSSAPSPMSVSIIQHVWQHDVRLDALQLRGGARDAVEFPDGDFERAGIVRGGGRGRPDHPVERHEALHRAFAVGGRVADDHRATVILQGGGGDFRGGRAEPVDHDDERPGVERGGIADGVHLDLSVRTARQHDGAVLDEETGEPDGLLERTAGVVAHIKDDSGDFLGLQFFEQFGDIHGNIILRV